MPVLYVKPLYLNAGGPLLRLKEVLSTLWLQRNVFSVFKKGITGDETEVCLLYAAGSVSSSWSDSSYIGSGLHNPALTSTMQRQPEKTSRNQGSDAGPDSEDEFSGYVKLLKVFCHSIVFKTPRHFKCRKFRWLISNRDWNKCTA